MYIHVLYRRGKIRPRYTVIPLEVIEVGARALYHRITGGKRPQGRLEILYVAISGITRDYK